jgi:peptide chain release factor 2
VPERALADVQQAHGDEDAAGKLLELEERKRREEIAKEKGDAQDVNFGSQIRSYVLHPYTMVKDHRTNYEVGDASRVLDGDLDGFVRAWLLEQATRSQD